MGRYETSLCDLTGLLVFLELAGVSAVLAYQRAGWSGAVLAPVGVLVLVLVLWLEIGAWIAAGRSAGSR